MKKNIITKAATVAVALIMASSFLTACNKQEVIENLPLDDTCVDGIEKPSKIIMMVDTTFLKENNRVVNGTDVFAEEYKKQTGIELEIRQPEHNQYYEKVNLSFASGDVPNVIELGGTYYPNYSAYGALWDMTDAYEQSTAPVKSIIDEQFVDALRIDGRLYGFPVTRGNGTITYARGDWMDELGIENPTNYDEFIDMLRAFKKKCSAPLTVAGFINSESPYNIYLPEFYQDANPDFFMDESTGQYIDGMSQPNMIDALQRMQDAYLEGLIDKQAPTNKTSDCRDKFNTGTSAVFNYWAGSWNKSLEDNMDKYNNKEQNGGEYVVRPLEPIAEAQYIERPPTALVITSKSANPMGIYKYLIEYSHDGGQGQMLFTHGVEGESNGKGNTQTGHWKIDENGNYVAVPYFSSEKLVEKAYYAPELTITTWDDPIQSYEQVRNSLAIFQKEGNSRMVPIPKTSDELADELPELDTVRQEVISKVVTGKMTPAEGIAEYQQRCESQISNILRALNEN